MTAAPPDEPGHLAVLAAVVARQSADLSVYAGFVTEALAGALPPEHLTVVRKRGLFGTKPDAPVLRVSVRIDDQQYTLARPRSDAPATASVAHVVTGIVLSTTPMGLSQWVQELTAALARLSETNADAAAALARMTSFTV